MVRPLLPCLSTEDIKEAEQTLECGTPDIAVLRGLEVVDENLDCGFSRDELDVLEELREVLDRRHLHDGFAGGRAGFWLVIVDLDVFLLL